jgi:energy-coupling factor transporter ATP-binding protein EcfA2/energy-coupling factor transporter transmembrane protein EcfT
VNNDFLVQGLTLEEGRTQILTDIGHTFEAGTVTLIIGRSGTGKTMLLEMLSGLREPSFGHIQIGSEPLWHNRRSKKQLNRRALLLLGTAFQHPEHQFFARSVREEFVYTLEPYKLPLSEQRRRMDTVHASSLDVTKSWMERNPFTLSGGEKRRVAFSLLQAAEPEWLLLDEPTAGVDQEGISRFTNELNAWKLGGKGAIVVTHDYENLLPAADRVLILHEGRVSWEGSPSELATHPQVLEDAGLTLTGQLKTLRALRQSGIALPDGWVNPRAVAEAIANGLKTEAVVTVKTAMSRGEIAETSAATADAKGPAVIMSTAAVSNGETIGNTKSVVGSEEVTLPSPASPARSSKTLPIPRFTLRDPLAVWLSYMLISTGILLQLHWFGWVVSALVTVGVIGYSGMRFRDWSKPAAAFLIFTIIASIVSGLTVDSSIGPTEQLGGHTALTGYFSAVGFEVRPAIETFFRFGRLIMVMLAGLVLLSGISHLRLKRAIEQRLNGLRHLRFPVYQFALVASLMVRFLPTIANEWHRFARIAAARGKYAVRPGRLPIRQMKRTAVPFLMALLRLGETWSLVLMARGVGREGWSPSQAVRMRLDKHDVYVIMAAIVILILLMLIRGIHL